MKLHKRALATVAVTLAAAIGLAIPASALSYGVGGVAIRNAKSTSATILGRGYPGQVIQITAPQPVSAGGSYTWSLDGQSGTSNQWLYHTNVSTGVTGFSAFMLFH